MKKNMIPLNEEQRQLVESCLSGERMALVHRAIREHIVVNETIFGFGYDDLYQEGCIWLCKAAATFQKEKGVKFETYAIKSYPTAYAPIAGLCAINKSASVLSHLSVMRRTGSSEWISCWQRTIQRIGFLKQIPCSCSIL